MARHQILGVGYQLDEIEIEKADDRGLKFRIKVFNGTDGHGVPTGFDGEREVYLHTTVTDGGAKWSSSPASDPDGDNDFDHECHGDP